MPRCTRLRIPPRIFLDLLDEEGGRPKASVLGLGVKTTLQNACLVSGFLAHLDDFDDTFLPTVFHPSAPAIPLALAIAEHRHLSGRAFLIACALGLDADAMARAFGLAGTQASALRETFGTMTKAFHPGRAASHLTAAFAVGAAEVGRGGDSRYLATFGDRLTYPRGMLCLTPLSDRQVAPEKVD